MQGATEDIAEIRHITSRGKHADYKTCLKECFLFLALEKVKFIQLIIDSIFRADAYSNTYL